MDVEIPELVPMDDYDARQARLESSMRWLLSKAYGGSIPSDYQEAFFSLGLSSVLASRLTSSELYWEAARAIFPEVKGQAQQGHTPLIQLLARRGLYLSDVNGSEVNEKLLQRSSPIHLMAHITLLEGIMMAYINTTLTPENVVPAVRKFATFSASSELPSNAEGAATFWVNKACAALCHHLRELNPSACPEALAINNIKDVNDGRCLAALVSFYCPQDLPISLIELGDSLAIANSLYNLQLLYNFCQRHLNASLLTLTVMDLFYTPEVLQLNLLTFFADLFHCLEVEKTSCVRDTGKPFSLAGNAADQKILRIQGPQPSQVIIPQISDPTKRSFRQSVSSNHARPQSSTVNGTRQSLLPRRHSDAHPADASSSNVHHSVAEAWTANNGIPAPSSKRKTGGKTSPEKSLLSNVTIDDSMDLDSLHASFQSCDDEISSLIQVQTQRNSSKDVSRRRVSEAPKTLGPLQTTSVVGGELSNSPLSAASDPLMPAQLRPSKEKLNNHSKNCEYSESGGRKKHKATTPDDNNCERSGPLNETSGSSSSRSTPVEDYKTPSLESVENSENKMKNKENALDNVNLANVEPENEPVSIELCRNRIGGQSYVVRTRPTLVDDAIAAGLPIVSPDGVLGIPRDGTPGYGSSNDGSDQELHKLRADSKGKESKGRNSNKGFFVSLGLDSLRLSGSNRPDKGGGHAGSDFTTSFAQIKKQKEAEDGSKGFLNQGSASEGRIGNLPKSATLLSCPRKKATFGALPNQTTWVQESAHRVSEKSTASAKEDTIDPMPSELIGLRLKLEENRRQIENRKRLAERQWHQQRQQMGKEAFIQVITKNKNGGDVAADEKSSTNGATSADHGVLVTSDEGKTKAASVPKGQNPIVSATEKPPGSLHDGVAHGRSPAFNDQSLRNVAENPIRTSDPDGLSRVTAADSNEVEENADNKDVILEDTSETVHSSTDFEEQTRYDASLDRINSSLTELQGEIQRLSRQQDQINNMVRSEVTQNTRGVVATSGQEPHCADGHVLSQGSQSVLGPTTPTKDEIYAHRFSARDALHPGIDGNPYSLGVQNFLGAETSLHQSRPSASPYSVPSYPAMGTPYPSRYHPAPPPVPLSMPQYQQPYGAVSSVSERMYSPMEPDHQYAALRGQFHPSAGMYPMVPGIYPHPIPTTYGHYQGSVAHQQYPHLVPRPEFPAGLPPHGMPFAEFSPQHSSFSSQPVPHNVPVSIQSPAGWPGSQQVQGSPHSSATPPELQNLPHNLPPASTPVGNPVSDQEHGINEGFDAHKVQGNVQPLSSTQDLGDAGLTELHPQSGGFFVNLGDSSTPTRQKPNLKTRHKAKSKVGSEDVLQANPVNSGSPSPVVAESAPSQDSETVERIMFNTSEVPCNSEPSPLVFVIGESTENEDDWLEMERRKQRLCELQTRRQEEQELRREKLSRDQERKREQQRMKQELSEQKRAEEKTRREAIFQTYLQKKREKEMSEETPSKPVPPVIRRQRSAMQRSARPKSQPTLPADIMTPTKGAPGTVGHSSHDNLAMESAIAKSPVSYLSQSNEKVSPTHGEVPLAFGGRTHRRPPTPDQIARTTQPTSDGSESSGSQMAENYTGPKLFVKPSQKSNRHIIINAISHCCLAGSVNKDVKDKVLEEIAKSDAKHFIILFRDAAMQYRGLYTYNPDQEEVFRIHGVGPKQLTDKVMEKFYKYNSGSKKFSEVTSTKHLTATIDAITVLSTVWQKTRAAAPSKKPV